MNCNICLTEYSEINKSCVSNIKCYTCNEGFVCNNCISDVDPCGSIFSRHLRYIKRAIRCPCCRTLNWNYHFNQIIKIALGSDVEEDSYNPDYNNPALKVFIKNRNY